MLKTSLVSGVALVALSAPAFASCPSGVANCVEYTYDEHGRLTEVGHTDGQNNSRKVVYEYDDVGNREKKTTS